jgi:hypothetical protein
VVLNLCLCVVVSLDVAFVRLCCVGAPFHWRSFNRAPCVLGVALFYWMSFNKAPCVLGLPLLLSEVFQRSFMCFKGASFFIDGLFDGALTF